MKKIILPIVGILVIIVIFIIMTINIINQNNSSKEDGKEDNNHIEFKVNVTQIDEEQNIKIEWNNSNVLKQVDINIKHGNRELFNKTIDAADSKITIPVNYGKILYKITPIHDNEILKSVEGSIGVTTSNYIIAPLVATMPVNLFTLELSKLTKTAPVFIMLERAYCYNWNKLPNNTYKIPPFSYVDNDTQRIDIHYLYNETALWIKELYELNNDSYFNLYYNDIWIDGALYATEGNNIPKSNYTLNLLSDGTLSSDTFNTLYNIADPYAVYEQQKDKYYTLVEKIRSGEIKYENQMFEYKNFYYVLFKENDNVNFITSTLYPFQSSTTFRNDFINDETCYEKKIYDVYNDLDNEQKDSFNSLLNVGSNYFSEAIENNKKVMLILGTANYNEHYFVEYIKFLKLYYGDEYIYYYKGHPRTPTDEYKLEVLTNLGLHDVDSTVAAEFIYITNPEIHIAGYESTTIQTVEAENVKALFNSLNPRDDVKDKYEVAIDFLEKDDPTYSSYLTDPDATYFLVKIFNPVADIFKIYNSTDNIFIEVV